MKTREIEVWKDVKGFEGYYQISNYGRLKSFKVNKHGQILKLTNKKGDYLTFVLCGKSKENKSTRIHRLVAETFLANPNNLPEVNHIDGNKQNNNVKNLEWVTRKENRLHSMTVLHPHQNDGMIYYNQHIRPKPIIQMDLKGNTISEFESAEMASKQTGVCARNILQVANKTPFNKKGLLRKSAGGYKWAFKSEVM